MLNAALYSLVVELWKDTEEIMTKKREAKCGGVGTIWGKKSICGY